MAIGLLLLSSGVLWTAAYILIIRQGVLDETHGMPLVALCANLSWELIFALVHPDATPQRAINGVWLALDLALLYQLLRYGPKAFPELSRRAFFATVALCLGLSFGIVLLFTREFDDRQGAYAAFGQNLLMSALFIGMLLRRRSLAGQSLAIGVCKLLGSACAALAFLLIMPTSQLLPFLAASILSLDLIYVGMVVGMRARARAALPQAVAASALFSPVAPSNTASAGMPWSQEH